MIILKRGSDSFELEMEELSEAFALAMRFGCDLEEMSIVNLSPPLSVTESNASALAKAFDLVFEKALSDPANFYPVSVDMGRLYLLYEFLQDGGFEISEL